MHPGRMKRECAQERLVSGTTWSPGMGSDKMEVGGVFSAKPGLVDK